MTTAAFRRPPSQPRTESYEEQRVDLLERILLTLLAERPEQELSLSTAVLRNPPGVLKTRTDNGGRTLAIWSERR